jgi:hypothetical protein
MRVGGSHELASPGLLWRAYVELYSSGWRFIFANQMGALRCVLKIVSTWCVETNFVLWVGVMNECYRSVELRSCDLIGGNTQLDYE